MPSPLVYLTLVLVIGVAAQWFAWRFRFPAILLLLVLGFALGRWADPDEIIGQSLLASVVSLSVAVILFEGGLSLRFRELAETGPAIFRLITVGCIVTWILATAFGRLLVFDTLRVAALAGAIFTVTGPTVIGPLLRHIRPHRRPSAVAKWEGIVVDPIGAILAVLVYETIPAEGPEAAAMMLTSAVLKTAAASLIVGGGGAALIVLLLRRHLIPDYLQAPIILGVVLGGFTLANELQHESGLAAVTVMGIAFANQKLVSIEHVMTFKENLGILLIGALFVVLAGRLQPENLTALGWGGVLFIVALILLIRPAAVLAATVRSTLTWRERIFIAWLAPRGIVAAAVASVFAIALSRFGPSEAIRADADRLVPLTFLVIITTVAIYGLTARHLALRLGVAEPDPQGVLIIGAGEFEREVAKALQEDGYVVKLIDSNRENVTAAKLDGLRTRHGNILSESLQEDLDLSGLGRLLAMTSSDEVNALAAIAFTHTFERAGVFQLPTPQADKKTKGQGGENRPTARRLFAPDATYNELTRRVKAGAVIKKTLLTPEFDYEAFQKQHGDRAIVLFIVSKTGDLKIRTADDTSVPVAGQKLVSLIDAAEPSSTKEKDESAMEAA
ncbi:MAG: sodium:proton antiporter [Planctomycetaceae bacterium]|nr:sodium:proton antiporter [Planctomycetaceae bacterium]